MLNVLANTTRALSAQLARRAPRFRGKVRVLRASDAILRRFSPDCIEQAIGGVRYALSTEDLIDFYLLYLGGYQSSLVRYLSKRLDSRGCVFWDVGANVGSVSLPVAAAVPTAIIHSFEPSPSVHRRLLRNLQLNPNLAPRIRPHPTALAETNGEADFYESNERFNSGVGGLGLSGNRASGSVRVPTARGDTLIEEGRVPAPTLLKIDVEGFEGEVLRGLERFLRTSTDAEIIFEHCPYRMRERGISLTAHCDFMESLGYELWVLEHLPTANDGAEHPLVPSDLERDSDIIARRK